MSIRTKNPEYVAGAVYQSGHLGTGEQTVTRGGQLAYSIYSGALLIGSGTPGGVGSVRAHGLVVSGGGRLHTVFPHQSISGVAVYFYDSVLLALSGTVAHVQSGYTTVGFIPGNTFGADLGPLAEPLKFDVPFHSGLCFSAPSGAAGFTVTYTTEYNPVSPLT